VLTTTDCYRILLANNQGEGQLKQALSHPTVVHCLRQWIVEEEERQEAAKQQEDKYASNNRHHGAERTLDCYLSCMAIRDAFARGDIAESEELMREFALQYGQQPPLGLDEEIIGHRDLVLDSISLAAKIENLRLLQYKMLFSLLEDVWLPFCLTIRYREMLNAKQVRLLLKLVVLENDDQPCLARSSSGFVSIVPSRSA